MTEPIELLEPLNEREQEIIECLVDGLSNREIADRLFLAPSTVKWYIRQLNQKLDTANRREIVEQVQELGLLEAKVPQESYFRPRENLPRQTTPFVGRDSELDELHAIIEKEEVRLLTILAPGGMGKTRIALEATEQQSNRFPDGVYFVSLQALSEPEQIIPQIASSTFFSFQNDNRSQKQQVLDFLSNKQMLLCIDNWEHLLDGALLVNEILAVAPQVKIIATSREKLNLLAETVYVLQGMEFPEWETPDDALRYDAVQLLLQSAQRVKPDWTITEDNLDYVARVCRLTQGMPLGVLLAMSWLDILPIEKIATEIQKNVDFLETDMRDIPERQQSIRVIFDYSWQKLSTKEQDAFVKMSVFRGGFTREAAEEITDANLRILQSLMNKALLQINKSGRYDLHELLRQYAEEKLDKTNESDTIQDTHLRYYTKTLQERLDKLKDDRQLLVSKEISADFDNVRMAWDQSVTGRNWLVLFDMIEPLHYHTQLDKQNHIEISEWQVTLVKQLLAAEQLNVQQEIFFAQLSGWIILYYGLISIDTFSRWTDIGLAYARKHQIPKAIARHTLRSGRFKYHQGKREEGLSLMLEAIHLARNFDDRILLAYFLWSLMSLKSLEGALEECKHLNQEIFSIARETGNKLWIASATMAHARLLFDAGLWEQSTQSYRDVLLLVQGNGSLERTHDPSWSLCVNGCLLMQLEQADKAYEDWLQMVYELPPNETTQNLIHIATASFRLIAGDYDSAMNNIQISYEFTQQYNLQELSRIVPSLYCLIAGMSGDFDVYLDGMRDLIGDDISKIVPTYLTLASAPLLWFLHHENEYERCVQFMSLVMNHPQSLPIIKQHPVILRLQTELEDSMGSEAYETASETGKSLNLEATVQNLLDEFGENQP